MKIVFLMVFCFSILNSQTSDEVKIENRLSDFKNYRFGNILLYDLSSVGPTFKKIVEENKVKVNEENVSGNDKEFEDVDEKVLEYFKANALTLKKAGRDLSRILKANLEEELIPDNRTINALIEKYSNVEKNTTIQKIYAIVSNNQDDINQRIIGVLFLDDEPNNFLDRSLDDLLSGVSKNNIYVNSELEDLKIENPKLGAKNALNFIVNNILQDNYRNVTLEAKGIGLDYIYFKPQVGVSSSIIDYSLYGVKEKDIQLFRKISNGEPQEYTSANQEILLSFDHIRWIMYDEPVYKDSVVFDVDDKGMPIFENGLPKIKETIKVLDENNKTNDNLPLIGIELKYGADDVNMPSFFSNRLNLSVLWSNIKLGMILPTSGWAGMQESVYGMDRSLTHGGFGIVGEFDFDLPIIPKSDVFRLSFGYTFGDAVASPYRSEAIGNALGNDPVLNRAAILDPANNEYLLRYNTTLHYTFGLDIDKDYLLRFGIGGSVYSMENWKHGVVLNQQDTPESAEFTKSMTDVVGGLSAKLDFMVKNKTTPYGATVNFFDETINLNFFVQFPVVDNMLYLKLRANGNVLLRENQRPWEIGSFFMPMANIIYVF